MSTILFLNILFLYFASTVYECGFFSSPVAFSLVLILIFYLLFWQKNKELYKALDDKNIYRYFLIIGFLLTVFGFLEFSNNIIVILAFIYAAFALYFIFLPKYTRRKGLYIFSLIQFLLMFILYVDIMFFISIGTRLEYQQLQLFFQEKNIFLNLGIPLYSFILAIIPLIPIFTALLLLFNRSNKDFKEINESDHRFTQSSLNYRVHFILTALIASVFSFIIFLIPENNWAFCKALPLFFSNNEKSELIVAEFLDNDSINIQDGEGSKDYNIGLFIVESLRADAFNRELMPNLYGLGAGIFFKNHYSNANCTVPSIYSILSGLYPLKYKTESMDHEKATEFFKNKGYYLRCYGPELDFQNLDKFALSQFELFTPKGDYIHQIDKLSTERIKADLQLGPVFSIGYICSTHLNYFFPKEFEIHKPFLEGDINLFKVPVKEYKEKIKNSYKNSVLYVDSILADFIRYCQNNDLMKNTIIIITGDHGESHFEDNLFAHATAFHDMQLRVPLLAFFPESPYNKREFIENSGITQHIDIMPTILTYLGYKHNLPGKNLLKGEFRNHAVFTTADQRHFYYKSALGDIHLFRKDKSTFTKGISTFEVRKGDLLKKISLEEFKSKIELYYSRLYSGYED